MELLLVPDVTRELHPPLLHQAPVALGYGEPAMRLTVAGAVMVLVVDEARRGHKELCLHEGLHF
jgi:hypothetical protein